MTYDEHIDCDNQLCEAEDKIIALRAEITEKDATIKHLREKAEFDMPTVMQGRFHNACTDPCDMIDGPCACGAWHSAKEWIMKLNKLVKQLQTENAEFEKELVATAMQRDDLQADIKQMAKQIDEQNKRQKEDLTTYGYHLSKCAYVQGLKGSSIEDCDCGFERALKGK